MPLTVHHYFPLGSDNVGDHLVARAIRERFARSVGPATFVEMPANDRYRRADRLIGLRGENVTASNREADVVLVGGSNMLEPRKPPKSGRGWHWGVFTEEDSLRRLDSPLMLVGMGTGSGFGKAIREYVPQAAAEVRLLHAKATASAVRDVTTVERLSRIGVRTECVGCPVTYLTDRPVTASKQSTLIAPLPPSRILRRFLGRWFMQGFKKYVAGLQRQGVDVLVTLHERSDLDVVAACIPPGTKTFYTEDVDELIQRYEESRGVIGFRLHAALLALGLGKPIVPVGVDWRGQAFIDTFELAEISIRPLEWRTFARLRQMTGRLLDNDRALLARLADAKAAWLRRYEDFWQRSAAMLNLQQRSTQIARRGAASSDGLRRTA